MPRLRIYPALLLLCGLCAMLSLSACGGPALPKPGNWVEKDWPEHDYQDVSAMARSVLASQFGFQLLAPEHDAGERFIEFQSLWNAKDADQAVFTGSGKRRKVWVQIEERALDVQYDPKAREVANGTKYGKQRIELRNGRYKKIVTRIAISCRRERNDSTVYADKPSRAEWKDDGFDDDAVQLYLDAISRRLRDTRGIEFDVSNRAKKIQYDYYREEGLSTKEKEARNKERTKRVAKELEKRREEDN